MDRVESPKLGAVGDQGRGVLKVIRRRLRQHALQTLQKLLRLFSGETQALERLRFQPRQALCKVERWALRVLA